MALERSDLEGEPTWVLTHPDGARLVVARTGALILSWQVPGPDGTLAELSDGYVSAAEIAELDGYRNAVLAPWSNRVRDARYTWEGTERDLEPGKTEQREALHGLVTSAPWEEVEADDETADAHDAGPAELRLVTAVEPSSAYPFPVQLCLTYRLEHDDGAHRLTFDLTATNTGNDDAPVGLGWHPYVRLPGHDTIDDLELRIPARTQVRTDDVLIPLLGDDAFEATDDAAFVPLAGHVIDDAWTDVVPDQDGVVRTVLSSPRTGASMTLEQDPSSRIVHAFSGDTLTRDRRASAAIEPCLFMTDAFNRPECADELPLPGGESRTLTASMVYRA